MKREDVEALRSRVLREADNAAGRGVKLADMTFSVEGDYLAALCRRWLAVESAPVRNVVGQQWDDVFAREGNVVWCSDLHPGQRVRIVPIDAAMADAARGEGGE